MLRPAHICDGFFLIISGINSLAGLMDGLLLGMRRQDELVADLWR